VVNVGDVLTIALERDVRVLKVMAPGTRRGPFPEAQTLYEDLTPPADPAAREDRHAERERGAGRPTKKERRDRDSFFEDQ
jgi:ribosome-associated heat shock protein Hsp15